MNLAAAYLKVKDFINTMHACNEALKIDEKNIKALYRRSRSRTQNKQSDIKDLKLAIKDLKLALSYSGEVSIIQELARVQCQYTKMADAQQKL